MNNKTTYIILGTTVLFLGIYLKSVSNNTVSSGISPSLTSSQATAASQVETVKSDEVKVPADRVEVVNFFGTQRCVSCLTIGKFSKKTIEEKFAEEVKSGKVVYQEINVDLPENREIVVKYKARGSSLFINTVRGETEEIAEDTTVWRLTGNEAQFISYLDNKINSLLGK